MSDEIGNELQEKRAWIKAPKTILGYFAITLGTLFTACVILVREFAANSALLYLIPPVLIFMAIVFIISFVGVFVTAWKDPTILLLGEVTGEVYLKYKKLIQGDSKGGEKVVNVVVSNTTSKRIKGEGSPMLGQGVDKDV